MNQPRLPAGKLPAAALQSMLDSLPHRDERVLVGPRVGEDAAVLDFGDRCLVAATDPVTFASDRIGWYSVHVNANDVAVLGATPRWFFAVLLLPEASASAALAAGITRDIAETCDSLGVTVCGGHTEITAGLDRPMVIGQMLGEVEKHRLVRKDALRANDRLLLTRGAAVEGTAILARERTRALEGIVPPEVIARSQALLLDPGISVVEAARVAMDAGEVRAMHDPTEGGILTAIWELARGAGVGVRVTRSAIPVLPETQAVCSALGVDPLRLIASGALLIATSETGAAKIASALQSRDIPVADIGSVVPATEGASIGEPGRWVALEPAERDEIARILETP